MTEEQAKEDLHSLVEIGLVDEACEIPFRHLHDRAHGTHIAFIIIHTAEGTYEGTKTTFRNPHTLGIAHLMVSREGKACAFAPLYAKVYHGGSNTEKGWNDASIGIELEAVIGESMAWCHFRKNDFTDSMMTRLVRLVANLCIMYDVPVTRWNIRGHNEVPHDPKEAFHTDPGKYFPWEDFIRRVDAERKRLIDTGERVPTLSPAMLGPKA